MCVSKPILSNYSLSLPFSKWTEMLSRVIMLLYRGLRKGHWDILFNQHVFGTSSGVNGPKKSFSCLVKISEINQKSPRFL